MEKLFANLPYYPWLIFGVAMLGTFMATLDSSIVNVALPVIAVSLGADLTVIQWVVTAYLLTISSLLPLFGRIGDMFGRQLIYTYGFLVFTIGSVACAMAFNVWLIVCARILQAIGAAMIMSNSQAIIAAAFPGKERGRALGLIGTIVALGSMSGPALGGLLVGSFGWESIFYVNVPIGIAAFAAGSLILPNDEKGKSKSFDFLGAILFSIGMVCFLWVLSEGHEWGWLSIKAVGFLFIAAILLISFVIYEKQIINPMIEISLFHSWPFTAGSLAGLLSFVAMFSNNMLMPFYLHSVLNMTPTQMGLIIAPFPILMAITAPISGYLSERIRHIYLTTSGLAIVVLGLIYLSTLNETSSLWHAALGQAIMGLGNGIFQSPNNNSILDAVPKKNIGMASGINALVRNIGMVSGTAVAVSIFEYKRQQILSNTVNPDPSQLLAAFLEGYHSALIVGAGFALIALLISLSKKGYNKT